MPVDEEQLAEALSSVLLKDEIDGLDEDLVSYMAGLLTSKVQEDEGDDTVTAESQVDEVLVPFLESVACPDDITAKAKEVVVALLESANGTKSSAPAQSLGGDGTAPKLLKQGIVNMAVGLGAHDEDANRYLWGTDKVKPCANTQIDAYNSTVSAKDIRKERQELESQRKSLEAQNASEEDSRPTTLVSMSLAAFHADHKNNQRDVQVKNCSVSLDNGTILMDGGDLKFAYQRRYGLIGENGVGTCVE